MLVYFSLAILILTLGASLFWRRSFGNNRSGFTQALHQSQEVRSPNFDSKSNSDNEFNSDNKFNSNISPDQPAMINHSSPKNNFQTCQFFKTKPVKFVKYIFLFSIALIFSLLFYQSYQQYQSWSQNEVSQYLLPPHQSINYFIFYVAARFFAPYLISLAIAILFLFSAKALNKKYNERFFYPEEPYFGALAIFLSAHPGWIFYAIAVILIYLLIQIFTLIYYKLRPHIIERSNPVRNNISNGANRLEQKSVRISLRYLWLPVAIFVIIIINYWLQTLGWWNLLKI